MTVAELDEHRLTQQSQLARLGVAFGGDRHTRVQLTLGGFVGEHNQTRGVVAADAAQAVGYFAAVLTVDEDDHVQHPGGHEATVF